MTRHSLQDIASIVSRAGFTGKSIAEAVAIAIHASRGDDSYDYLASVDPLIHDRGLFATSLAGYKSEDWHKLFDPRYAASELYKAYRANGLSWNGHRQQDLALQPERVKEIESILRSRMPTTPLDKPSILAETAYNHRL